MRLGLVGFGSIGQAIVESLSNENALDQLVAVLVRTPCVAKPSVPLLTNIDELVDRHPTVVIEAAGHDAVRAYGHSVLTSGADFVVSSVGALAYRQSADMLIKAAATGRTKVCISAGAIAGLDGLIAARLAGLDRVTYTSYKPPAAWRGTDAERVVDLDHIEDEVTFFDGTARTAAVDYPKNANVSAAIALADVGFDRTAVRLVSSRKVAGPLGVIEASGDFGWFDFKIFAHAFPHNPKSSRLTAFGLLQSARFGIGFPLTAS